MEEELILQSGMSVRLVSVELNRSLCFSRSANRDLSEFLIVLPPLPCCRLALAANLISP